MLLVVISAQVMAAEENKKIDTSRLTANQYRELLYSKSIPEAIEPVYDTNIFGELVQLTQEQVAANRAANREFLKNKFLKEDGKNNPYDAELHFESGLSKHPHMFWSHSHGSSGFWSALHQARPERLNFDFKSGVVERPAYRMPPVVDKDVKDSSQNKTESARNELNGEK